MANIQGAGSSSIDVSDHSDGSIGYNPSEVKKLLNQIGTFMDNIKSSIVTNFVDLRTVLHEQWVGEDEQDYEKALINRINYLYVLACSRSQETANNVFLLRNSWHRFQKNNDVTSGEKGDSKIDSGAEFNYTAENVKIDDSKVAPITNETYGESGSTGTDPDDGGAELNITDDDCRDKPLSFVARTDITDTTRRGLKDKNSGKSIQTACEDFKNALDSTIDGNSDDVANLVDTAFPGATQTVTIKKYLRGVITALKEILSAIGDLYKLAENMTIQAYSTGGESGQSMESSVESGFDENTVQTKMTENMDSIKWGTGGSGNS